MTGLGISWNDGSLVIDLLQISEGNMRKSPRSSWRNTFRTLKRNLRGFPPENVWNYDETNLKDDPGKEKYIMKRGTKYPEAVMDNSKLSYSLMFCGNGAGQLFPPYVVFKSKHLYSWVSKGPKGARYNRSKSGWFDETTFQDWFFSMLLSDLKKQQGKKVLIGDNLSSHLSESVIKACNDNNISFVCLLPNSTHLLQPLDVAFFTPLKRLWRHLLRGCKQTS